MASQRAFGDALYRAMKDGDDEAFTRLLASHEGRLDAVTDDCIAIPLISAVFSERLDCLKALLAAGADVNRRDTSVKGSSYNLRALEAALWFEYGDMEQTLLEEGAEEDFGTHVFRRDVQQVRRELEREPSLLQSAYIHPHFNLLHVAADLSSAELTSLLLEAGLDPNAGDADGHAPMRYAARNAPALGVIEALAGAGADVNHASRTGITALTAACRHAESLPTVRRLLELGADPNLVPKNKVSALMKAAGNRVAPLVELLLAHGADPGYRGKGGETALDVARRRKADDVLTLLQGS